jgi:hypothetical protein
MCKGCGWDSRGRVFVVGCADSFSFSHHPTSPPHLFIYTNLISHPPWNYTPRLLSGYSTSHSCISGFLLAGIGTSFWSSTILKKRVYSRKTVYIWFPRLTNVSCMGYRIYVSDKLSPCPCTYSPPPQIVWWFFGGWHDTSTNGVFWNFLIMIRDLVRDKWGKIWLCLRKTSLKMWWRW